MVLFHRPSLEARRRFLQSQSASAYSYRPVGATATESKPPGFRLDCTRVVLGTGEAVFEKACAALLQWRQFQLGWVDAWPADTPLAAGAVVTVLAKAGGMWWLNACRIVYVIDDRADVRRFGFAYGTLAEHVERGEERFVVEWRPDTGTVDYEILAFSRPRHPLAWLGYPLARRVQKRFARQSAQAMLRAVREKAPAAGEARAE